MDGIHLMVTHAPPDCAIRKNFSEEGLRQFGHNPKTWVDESALLIEKLWRMLGQPPLYCGHMHRSVTDGNVHILDENEVVIIDEN